MPAEKSIHSINELSAVPVSSFLTSLSPHPLISLPCSLATKNKQGGPKAALSFFQLQTASSYAAAPLIRIP
jgi:hypothetical protein